MFKRSIIENLENWKQSEYKKPLILRGARQVGKTTIVNEFGKTYENYLYYNMEKSQDKSIFEMDLPLKDLSQFLFSAKGMMKKKGQTLLFIDEIQNSPKAIALLRYFYEELPEIHVIAAGSLLENLVDFKVSFPVGRVDYLPVRPCSFCEFLGALGKEHFCEIMKSNPANTLPFHTELMYLFQQYMLVGGMPEIVSAYSRSLDLFSIDNYYETLITGYKDDTEKYVKTGKLSEVVRYILSYGWASAGEIITLNNFANSAYKSREVSEAFMLLEKAMLAELAYPISSPFMPIIPETRRKPKLLWLDTGLVNYQAGLRKTIIGAADVVDIWKGRIAEQVVSQELMSLSNKIGEKRCFWSKLNGGAEVDFVYVYDSSVFPIEVKNGINSHLRSLQVFMDNSPVNCGIRVWSGNFSIDDCKTPNGKIYKLINLPFYMISVLNQVLKSV